VAASSSNGGRTQERIQHGQATTVEITGVSGHQRQAVDLRSGRDPQSAWVRDCPAAQTSTPGSGTGGINSLMTWVSRSCIATGDRAVVGDIDELIALLAQLGPRTIDPHRTFEAVGFGFTQGLAGEAEEPGHRWRASRVGL
jgi:hypothetical protein